LNRDITDKNEGRQQNDIIFAKPLELIVIRTFRKVSFLFDNFKRKFQNYQELFIDQINFELCLLEQWFSTLEAWWTTKGQGVMTFFLRPTLHL